MRRKILLLKEAISFFWSIRKRGWWKSWPFLPLPPKEYLLWRLGTNYGTYPIGVDEAGKPVRISEKPYKLRDYLRIAWKDRKKIGEFLIWRRKMLNMRKQ